MEATIEVSGLRKRFEPVVALDGMTFTVVPGQVTGFVGPNGAGKSTTMRVIVGLDAPDEGEALVGGRRYQGLRYPLTHVGSLLDAGARVVAGTAALLAVAAVFALALGTVVRRSAAAITAAIVLIVLRRRDA